MASPKRATYRLAARVAFSASGFVGVWGRDMPETRDKLDLVFRSVEAKTGFRFYLREEPATRFQGKKITFYCENDHTFPTITAYGYRAMQSSLCSFLLGVVLVNKDPKHPPVATFLPPVS